ncbi:hypothetical protein MPSI1_002835 [Malassezia psittaci]|uniref:GPI transamidase component PIG-S n=1 Tax=Malassezia psittaci TaxID=1821823 RepID=A0AAF0FC60_9BASI|nr:hypothetical protein MPSI1_002835 [Malassezia psittaci]
MGGPRLVLTDSQHICARISDTFKQLDPANESCIVYQIQSKEWSCESESGTLDSSTFSRAYADVPITINPHVADSGHTQASAELWDIDTILANLVETLTPWFDAYGVDSSHPSTETDSTRIQYEKNLRVVFSLLNEDASHGGAASDWQLSDALQLLEHPQGETPASLAPVQPLIDLLRASEELHTIQLESQIQWYAPLEFSPSAEETKTRFASAVSAGIESVTRGSVIAESSGEDLSEFEHQEVPAKSSDRSQSEVHTLTESQETDKQWFGDDVSASHTEYFASPDDVRVFINSAQWNLESYGVVDTSINSTRSGQAEDQTLHFVLFLPSNAHRPLRVRDVANDQVMLQPAWVVPQWGGVVVLNRASAPKGLSSPLTLQELEEPMQLFTRQLAQLMGVPLKYLDSKTGSLDLAMQGLTWRRIIESARSSIETLGSIVRLVDKIPILGVDASVQKQVYLALKSLNNLDHFKNVQTQDAQNTQDTSLSSLLNVAVSAQKHASYAFYDPSMLATLYFPDEHKYAIYTPLFGPLFVPLFVSVVRELKAWTRKRRTAQPSD